MKKALSGLHKAEAVVAGLFLAIMTIVTFSAAVNRFTFKIPMPWSEELVRYLLVWDSIIAAAYGIPAKAHVGIDLISSRLKSGADKVLTVFTSILALIFLGIMFYYGCRITGSSAKQLSPAMQIPLCYVNACLPVGAACMMVEFIVIIVHALKSPKEDRK